MDHHNLSEHRRCELEELAATRREHGRPAHEIAAEIAQTAAITPLWAWRLAKGWRRSELLGRLRRLGDASVEESMLWRWEIGERHPSTQHLDRLCQVYQTRPDLLGYSRAVSSDGTDAACPPTRSSPEASPLVDEVLDGEPLAMVQALTASGMSPGVLDWLERSAESGSGGPPAPPTVQSPSDSTRWAGCIARCASRWSLASGWNSGAAWRGWPPGWAASSAGCCGTSTSRSRWPTSTPRRSPP